MKCAACQNLTVLKTGEIDLRIAGRLFLVQNVSYEECQVCGEKVLAPEVSQDLFEKITHKKYVEKSVVLPVLDGTYG